MAKSRPGDLAKKFRGRDTVDGRNPANQLVDSLSHYLPGFYTSEVVVEDF